MMEIKEVESGIAYEITTYSGDIIEIGDRNASSFKPCFTLNRWDGECKLSVFSDSEIDNGNLNFDGQIVHWDTANIAFKFYPKEPEIIEEEILGKVKKFRQNEYGALEFEIILKEKPQENEIRFSLDSKNLVFYYQPPLHPEHPTWEAGRNGQPASIRPSNVVGSYAVYHKTRGNFHREEDADKYKTGKAFHIYRPRAIDSNGNAVWCDLLIEENQLIIRLPEDFYNQASYPVKIDPTFGYTSVGGSAQDVNWDDWCEEEVGSLAYGSWFTCPEDCYPVKIYGFLDVLIDEEFFSTSCEGEAKTTFHIAKRSDNSCITYTESKDWSTDNNFYGWLSLTVENNPLLSANTDYWLLISNCWYSWSTDCTCNYVHIWNVYYDSAEANKGVCSGTDCDGCFNPLPDPVEWYPRIFSVYCSYEVRKERSYSIDAHLTHVPKKSLSLDSIVLWKKQLSSSLDTALKGVIERYNNIDALLTRRHSRNLEIDSSIILRRHLLYSFYSSFKGTIEKAYSYDLYLGSLETIPYNLDCIVAGSRNVSLGIVTSLVEEPFNIKFANDFFTSLAWCTRWDEGNWSIILEVIADKDARDTIIQHITPGAVSELYNILGQPKYIDTTYSSGNTFWLYPRRGLGRLRAPVKVACKSYSDTLLRNGMFHIKMECVKL